MRKANILYFGVKNSFYEDLKMLLNAKEIDTKQVDTMRRATEILKQNPPHLLIAANMESGVAGLTLCQDIRQIYSGLFVLFSKSIEVDFHTLALGLGADASLAHEHGVPLLAANVEAMLRRYQRLNPIKTISFGNLTIDASKRDVFVAGEAVALSTMEFQLIWSLAKRQGSVVTRDEIHQELYQSTYNGYDRSIDLYVSRIRHKIGDIPGAPKYLKTVRGIGYQFIPGEKENRVMQSR